MDIDKIVRKYAIKNRLEFGKAQKKAVVGKIIAEVPDAKKEIKEIMKIVEKIIEEVNNTPKEKLEEEIKKYTFIKKEEKKKELELKNIKNNVVLRFPPEPSGYLHIGHAKALFLNYYFVKKYRGKFILRFDDTNPKKEKIEYVNAIKEDLNYLNVKFDEEIFTSDYMEEMYNLLEKLIKKGKAYVCSCSPEEISKNRREGKACSCRDLSIEEQIKRWKEIKKGKEMIVRWKGNLKSKNTAMRDPTLFRIIKEEHFRQKNKYIVWPTYDFAGAVMDSITGVTHALRSKEYELRDEVYFKLLEDLELRKPELVEFSRISIKNAPISKRLIVPLVEKGIVSGWDDPRLPTIKALKRRGILPEAIENFVLSFGLSKTESNPGWEKLLAENRKLLDKKAKHYFFVKNPIELRIEEGSEYKIILNSYENKKDREFTIKDKIFISKEDFDKLNDKEEFRLKDFKNAVIDKKNKKIKLIEDKKVAKKIQWVSNGIKGKLIIPKDLFNGKKLNEKSLEIIKGLAEKNIEKINTGEIIQFERIGFFRLDNKEKMEFIWSC